MVYLWKMVIFHGKLLVITRWGHDSGGILGTDAASGDPAGVLLCVATRKQVLRECGLLRRWAMLGIRSSFLEKIWNSIFLLIWWCNQKNICTGNWLIYIYIFILTWKSMVVKIGWSFDQYSCWMMMDINKCLVLHLTERRWVHPSERT